MKLVDAALMRNIDSAAINGLKIPSEELMENAGRAVYQLIIDSVLPALDNPKIAIVCGRGNNGGDGFVIGRYLLADYRTDFYLVGSDEKLSSDCRTNYDKIVKSGNDVTQVIDDKDIPDFDEYDLIIDAIFGTGFSGAPRGISSTIIDSINRSRALIMAVDCPSGLDVSTGQVEGVAVVADFTATLALPKPGLFVSPGRELSGAVSVLPIGIPDKALDSFEIDTNLITGEMVAEVLPIPEADGHKGDFGKVLILAGSPGLTGAATLAGLAAARSGSGLVTVGLPRSLNQIMEAKLTEIMTASLPEVKKRSVLSLRGRGDIKRLLNDRDAAAIGPGIGRHHETGELIRRLVIDLEYPAIIDADGLYPLSGSGSPLLSDHVPLILTPHPGEFARLTGETADRNPILNFDLISDYANRFNSIIVLKGSPTIIASPDGKIYLNPTGNVGMATGGSGDVLTGIIVSFLGQKMEPLEAALCGVFIHGLAGDLAVDEINPRSLMAGDLIDYLSPAFDALENEYLAE